MIRKYQDVDMDAIMLIWLNGNMEAHSFIDSVYWNGKLDTVRMMIPQAEVYVSEHNGAINGFIGIMGTYIAGIFVDQSERAKGIGSKLLDFAKKNREKLDLNVYKKNIPAVDFYMKRGFKIVAQGIDDETSEIEYSMCWER